ncbi:MAG: hypothetical protein HRT35_01070 [Algicola sp.]|nr:hypothetical protein [Algicola sp.]
MSEEKARNREISDGLLRQRRNLLVTSVAMPLFYISGASVEKINLLGTIVKIKNSEIAMYVLVTLFVYFVIRYWQYYNEENYIQGMKLSIKEHLSRFEREYLNSKATREIKEFNNHDIKIHFLDSKHRNALFSDALVDDQPDENVLPFVKRCSFYLFTVDNTRNSVTDEFHLKMQSAPFDHWTRANVGPSHLAFYQSSFVYCSLLFYIMRVWGWIRYMFTESYFTDYQLPFLVALCSAGATTYTYFI